MMPTACSNLLKKLDLGGGGVELLASAGSLPSVKTGTSDRIRQAGITRLAPLNRSEEPGTDSPFPFAKVGLMLIVSIA